MLKPELLAPAGNFEKLQTALLYGADAVYLGGTTFNLRASCDGFSAHELEQGCLLAQKQNGKIYYCLNSLPVERDMAGLPAVIEQAAQAGVAGFIVADPGTIRLVQRYAPTRDIHLSTQANTTNSEAVAFWQDQGISRVNLARELSAQDIAAVRKKCPDIELEIFVHGAMCLAVSGQCLLSSWLNNRPANKGRCTQPCRFEYRALESHLDSSCVTGGLVVGEELREAEPLWTVHEGERYSSFWSPWDLCLMPYLPWFVCNGIDSLKIEGRMKGAAYVGHTVDCYRVALDTAYNAVQARKSTVAALSTQGEGDPLLTGHSVDSFHPQEFLPELLWNASRPLGSGFFIEGSRRNFTDESMVSSGAVQAEGKKVPSFGHPLLGRVVEQLGDGKWAVDVRGSWKSSQSVEVMLPGGRRPVITSDKYGLENHKGERAASVGSGIRGVFYTDIPGIVPGVFIRGAA